MAVMRIYEFCSALSRVSKNSIVLFDIYDPDLGVDVHYVPTRIYGWDEGSYGGITIECVPRPRGSSGMSIPQLLDDLLFKERGATVWVGPAGTEPIAVYSADTERGDGTVVFIT